MIYDCFPFFNELDLLEIRLHEHTKFADKLFIKPYNNIAKERYINIEIETTFDELLQTIKTKK